MIKKHFYTWKDIETMCTSIVTQMYNDDWRPDYIVGITRGGNIPATIISNMTGIRCEALKVSLRDDDKDSESTCWMAEDAFGYLEASQKNILLVIVTSSTCLCKSLTSFKCSIFLANNSI